MFSGRRCTYYQGKTSICMREVFINSGWCRVHYYRELHRLTDKIYKEHAALWLLSGLKLRTS